MKQTLEINAEYGQIINKFSGLKKINDDITEAYYLMYDVFLSSTVNLNRTISLYDHLTNAEPYMNSDNMVIDQIRYCTYLSVNNQMSFLIERTGQGNEEDVFFFRKQLSKYIIFKDIEQETYYNKLFIEYEDYFKTNFMEDIKKIRNKSFHRDKKYFEKNGLGKSNIREELGDLFKIKDINLQVYYDFTKYLFIILTIFEKIYYGKQKTDFEINSITIHHIDEVFIKGVL